MNRLPRHDLQRAEVDSLHAQCVAQCSSFTQAHALFAKRVKNAFSPLTECAAIAYANAAYHADIHDISMHFNVQTSGHHFDIVLIVAEQSAVQASKVIIQHSYTDIEIAMDTCRVLNALFQLLGEGEHKCHS